mmetsp:Transcript_51185/g.141663  ORF Transcript_51185/g.141663 Transcript_51185/m.141663 type:complete len:203 (+) Transcript_51185:276-884(+)
MRKLWRPRPVWSAHIAAVVTVHACLRTHQLPFSLSRHFWKSVRVSFSPEPSKRPSTSTSSSYMLFMNSETTLFSTIAFSSLGSAPTARKVSATSSACEEFLESSPDTYICRNSLNWILPSLSPSSKCSIICLISSSVGFWPNERSMNASSSASIEPEPSRSREKKIAFARDSSSGVISRGGLYSLRWTFQLVSFCCLRMFPL